VRRARALGSATARCPRRAQHRIGPPRLSEGAGRARARLPPPEHSLCRPSNQSWACARSARHTAPEGAPPMCSPAQSALRRGLAASYRNRRAGPRLFGALRRQAPHRQPVGTRGFAARGVAPQPAGAPSPLQPAATRRNLRCNPRRSPRRNPRRNRVAARALHPTASRPTALAPPRPASMPPAEPSAAAAGPTPHRSGQRAPALRRPAQRHAPHPAFAPPPSRHSPLLGPRSALSAPSALATLSAPAAPAAPAAPVTPLRARCRCSPCVAQPCSCSCTLGPSTRPSCGACSA